MLILVPQAYLLVTLLFFVSGGTNAACFIVAGVARKRTAYLGSE